MGRKNSTGARPHSCTRNGEEEQYRSQTSLPYKEPGGRTVQEPDLTPVQGNQDEEQYRSQTSLLYKGTRMKNSTGARPHSCTREPGWRTVQELDLNPEQGTRRKNNAEARPKNNVGAIINCQFECYKNFNGMHMVHSKSKVYFKLFSYTKLSFRQ